MYAVAVRRDFMAQHFLIGNEWGSEGQRHTHHYLVEVCVEAPVLNNHGYLIDIVEIETHLGDLIAYFRDQTLNELREFVGLNPSLEHFARIFCETMAERLGDHGLSSMTVKVWENEKAWASYRRNLS